MLSIWHTTRHLVKLRPEIDNRARTNSPLPGHSYKRRPTRAARRTGGGCKHMGWGERTYTHSARGFLRGRGRVSVSPSSLTRKPRMTYLFGQVGGEYARPPGPAPSHSHGSTRRRGPSKTTVLRSRRSDNSPSHHDQSNPAIEAPQTTPGTRPRGSQR